MKKLTAALAVSAIVAAPVGAKTLTIGLDVSASNPLVSSDVRDPQSGDRGDARRSVALPRTDPVPEVPLNQKRLVVR